VVKSFLASSRVNKDSCVYKKFSGSSCAFLMLYIDDILLVENNCSMLQETNESLERCFLMNDLGEAAYIMGIRIYSE
jgi:hypothetical protein